MAFDAAELVQRLKEAKTTPEKLQMVAEARAEVGRALDARKTGPVDYAMYATYDGLSILNMFFKIGTVSGAKTIRMNLFHRGRTEQEIDAIMATPTVATLQAYIEELTKKSGGRRKSRRSKKSRKVTRRRR